MLLVGAAVWHLAQAQTPPEPGLLPGISVINISKNTPKFASVFPQVAVSRANPNLVAVAWRQYNLPVDTNALEKDRVAECHVAISNDGGKTFKDRNMMDVLRTEAGPRLWGCNAPWVAISKEGTMYFGGSLFTAGGIVQVEPKAGRAGVSVSTDRGTTWSKMIPGHHDRPLHARHEGSERRHGTAGYAMGRRERRGRSGDEYVLFERRQLSFRVGR